MPQGIEGCVRQALTAYLSANPGLKKTALAGRLGVSRQALHAYLKPHKAATPRSGVLREIAKLVGGFSVGGCWFGPEQFATAARPSIEPGQRELPFDIPVKFAAADRSVRAEVRRSSGDELVIALRLKLG